MFHSQEVIDYIEEKLRATWSPEQIACTPCELKMPSRRTIYRWIYEKHLVNGNLKVLRRKRLTPEVLGEINEMILNTVCQPDKQDDDGDDPGRGGNSGTMIVDTTCAPSNIRYPQDASLLNEARENTEKLLDVLHDPADGRKPRTYRKKAHKDFLQFSCSRKKSAKKTRKAVGQQLRYLKRSLAAIDEKIALGWTLTAGQDARMASIRTLYDQQKYMYDNHSHTVANRFCGLLCAGRPESRWNLGRSWTSVL